MIDNPLAMRSWQAYQAYIASAGAAKTKKEIEDIQKRPGPKLLGLLYCTLIDTVFAV